MGRAFLSAAREQCRTGGKSVGDSLLPPLVLSPPTLTAPGLLLERPGAVGLGAGRDVGGGNNVAGRHVQTAPAVA